MAAPRDTSRPDRGFRRRALLCACLIFSNGIAPAARSQGLDINGSTDATALLSSRGSTASSSVSLTVTAVGAVVAGVVYLVILAAKGKGPEAEPGESPTPAGSDEGAGLISQGFVGGGGTLATLAAQLVHSPSAMDALTSEAAAGQGARLDALARSAGLPRDVVASAWLDTAAAPTATRVDAFAAVVRFIRRIGPELKPDPALAERLLASLAAEQARADFPANAPTHALVATWTGLSVAEVAPIVAQTLTQPDGRPMSRAALHTDAVEVAERVGRNLGIAHPVAVSAKAEDLLASARHYGVPDERFGAGAP